MATEKIELGEDRGCSPIQISDAMPTLIQWSGVPQHAWSAYVAKVNEAFEAKKRNERFAGPFMCLFIVIASGLVNAVVFVPLAFPVLFLASMLFSWFVFKPWQERNFERANTEATQEIEQLGLGISLKIDYVWERRTYGGGLSMRYSMWYHLTITTQTLPQYGQYGQYGQHLGMQPGMQYTQPPQPGMQPGMQYTQPPQQLGMQPGMQYTQPPQQLGMQPGMQYTQPPQPGTQPGMQYTQPPQLGMQPGMQYTQPPQPPQQLELQQFTRPPQQPMLG